MQKLILPFLLCSFFLFQGCGDDKEDVCVEQPVINKPANISIVQLHNDLLTSTSRDSLINLLSNNPVIAEVFLKRNQYPDDSVMVSVLRNRFANPGIDTLQSEIKRVFGDLSELNAELETAYSNLIYYYPEFEVPRIKTVATGLDYDLYVSDSLVVIGLDYFLGPGAKYRPVGLYNYMLQRYIPESIVPSIMLLYGISPSVNVTDMSNKTMLADMITYGKAYYFAKHMLPCTPDSIMISYTAEEIDGTRENEAVVWTHFIENELLFETNHEIKKKYIEERPKTYEIGEKAPGRIGTWVGWQIVREFMDRNPDITLADLMAIEDPQVILNGSKYKP